MTARKCETAETGGPGDRPLDVVVAGGSDCQAATFGPSHRTRAAATPRHHI
jgi:hypothetical protein